MENCGIHGYCCGHLVHVQVYYSPKACGNMFIKTGKALLFICGVLRRHNLYLLGHSRTRVCTAKVARECPLSLGTQNLQLSWRTTCTNSVAENLKEVNITIKGTFPATPVVLECLFGPLVLWDVVHIVSLNVLFFSH